MKNQVFNVTISSTSKKDKGTFKSDRITAYLVPTDSKEATRMVEFGLTPYTSKNGDTFFIVKLAQTFNLYNDSTENYVPLDGTKEGDLFKTKEGQTVLVNIVQGESKGNKFYRLQAIQDKNNAMEEIKVTNPFEM